MEFLLKLPTNDLPAGKADYTINPFLTLEGANARFKVEVRLSIVRQPEEVLMEGHRNVKMIEWMQAAAGESRCGSEGD
jgi:hypothetical protein